MWQKIFFILIMVIRSTKPRGNIYFVLLYISFYTTTILYTIKKLSNIFLYKIKYLHETSIT